MRRYVGRLFLAMLVLFVISTKFVDVTIGAGFGRHPIETAWTATGCAVDNFVLDYWVAAPATDNGQDLSQLVKKMGARLGAKDSTVFAGKADGIRFANLDGRLSGDGELVLTVQAEKTVTHIGFSCCYGAFPADLLGLERRVLYAAAGLAPRGRFFWSVRGQQPGRLKQEGWRAMWARVLATVNATRRGDNHGEDLIEAFSPLLPAESQGIEVGVNLVLAHRYNASGRATTIVLASPSLGEEL